ncbi:S-layer homology domain-containing protein [Alkalihalophilus marmarensis]|uniref:S-layer homology domain-containing protein n=1 Tax=Alkalihalophilus marmarensis TaxID=521377 RepID=UPI003D8148ED
MGAEAGTKQFSDLNENHWAYDNIMYLVEKGAMQGDAGRDTVRPNDSINRAEAAVIIARTLDLDVDPAVTTDAFRDVPATHWANPYIAAVQAQKPGVINGYNGLYRPADTITRQEMASITYNAYKEELELVEGVEIPFTDTEDLAWGKEFIEILYSNGIIAGATDTTFNPTGNVTRAQAAAFVHRTEVEDVREERTPIVEDVVVENVQASTVNGVTTVAADVLGTEAGTTATVEIFANGDTDEDAAVTRNVTVADGAIAATFKQLPLGDHVARVTVGEGEDAVSADAEFTIEAFTVESVAGTTTVVDADTEEQFLGFTVNGETLALDYLVDELGFEVEFLVSDENVLEDAATGELNSEHLIAGESFDYQVNVTGEDFDVTSEAVTVDVESYSTTIVSIDGLELLFNDDVKNESGVLSTHDEDISLSDIAVEYKDGETTKLAPDATQGEENVFEFSSSDQTVALIDDEGTITPISDGDVTFTVEAEGVEYSFDVTVTSEEREATDAEVSKSSIGLVVNATDRFALTVKDQFGDAVKGFNEEIAAVENSDEESILTAVYAPEAGTDEEGKVNVEVEADSANEGTGTLEIKNEEGDVLASLNVMVDSDLEVASRSLELTNPSSDLELDVNPFNSDDSTLEFVLNEYNKSGLKIKGHDFNNEGRYTIVSSDEDVLTVEGTPAADSTDGSFTVEAAGEGTATIQIKEGSIVRYQAEVTVVDTTPTLAGASFVNNLEITSTEALSVEDIIDSLTFTGDEGDAEVAYEIDGTDLVISLEEGGETVEVASIQAFSVDVEDAGFFTEDDDFFLGDTVSAAGFVADTEGTIVLRLNRTGETRALVTTIVKVDVE